MRKGFLHKILYSKTHSKSLQFFRYTLVSAVALIIDFGLLYILTENFDYHFTVSANIAFLVALFFNILISVIWVFNGKKVKNVFLEVFFFLLIGLIGYFINEATIWFLGVSLSVFYLYAKIVSSFVVYIWNFIARRLILYSNQSVFDILHFED